MRPLRTNYKGISFKRLFLFLMIASIILTFASPMFSSEVIIIGETRLKPISDMAKKIIEKLPFSTETFRTVEVSERLNAIVVEEKAKVVVTLDRDAVYWAVNLPETIPVIYSMLASPPRVKRQNITGVYLQTPIKEYISLINKYFPGFKKIGVIYGPDTELPVKSKNPSRLKALRAENSYEFVNALKSLNDVDALLLLPDKNLLSASAIKEVYLFSFKNKISVLGISSKYVKEGSLFALVFDLSFIGEQLRKMTKAVLKSGNAGSLSPCPPEKFNLYINIDTAKKMNIDIPKELLAKAKKVYP
jgi:putative ABC transport system substrate-binding protein